MFDGNKKLIINECKSRNCIRRVLYSKIDDKSFFYNITGDLVVTGYGASNRLMVYDLIASYMERKNIPTIILSNDYELFEDMENLSHSRADITVSYPNSRNYHLFYGMAKQKFLEFVRMAIETFEGSSPMQPIVIYTSAILDIVSVSYPISLPAVEKLLENDDDFISRYALSLGLSNVIAENIRANHQAGIMLRRACEKLNDVFKNVYINDIDTKYNFQSGAINNCSTMAFYSASSEQKILNIYIKEALDTALSRVPKIRVILDEMAFSEHDILLEYLFTKKRQYRIELIFISTNVKEAASQQTLNFANIIMFLHDTPTTTEIISKELFGTYQHAQATPVGVKNPGIFGISLQTAVHWHIAPEERLRVRALDLYPQQNLFSKTSDFIAIKTSCNGNIYLVESRIFLPQQKDLLPDA